MVITEPMMQSLESKFQSLNSKIAVLNHALDLSGALGNDDYNQLASNVDQEMNSVRKELYVLKLQVQHEKENLIHLQELKMLCEDFRKNLIYTSSNLPPKLPQQSKPTVIEVKKDQVKDGNKTCVNKPADPSLIVCEYLRLLTTEQFAKVPKYIKGRLQYDKVNAVIEKLNGVFAEKYKILKQRKKTLNETNRRRYEVYKSQENKNTDGVHFIIDHDIEDFSTLKMDNTLRSIFTMLRHCGLMHEIRGGQCVRYSCYSY